MNQEDFVTLKTAVLLKLKGFDCPCEHSTEKRWQRLKTTRLAMNMYISQNLLFMWHKNGCENRRAYI